MLDHRTNGAFHRIVRTIARAGWATRVESDSLGSKEIPADAYWGINVSRALDNFAISGRPISIYPDLIFGYACVKQAAARANAEVGALDSGKADLIDRACEEIKDGGLHAQFVVDVIQGGAGTSTNMNVNEVIANRAIELTDGDRFAAAKPNGAEMTMKKRASNGPNLRNVRKAISNSERVAVAADPIAHLDHFRPERVSPPGWLAMIGG
jgi:aspartate ammonia-lyase